MTARNPDVRRAIVAHVADDGSTARVVIEWMKLARRRDQAAIQDETPTSEEGIEALAVEGVRVGDEVLVDLRPLPIVWLSFLFFVVPLILAGITAGVSGLLLGLVGLPKPAVLALQVLACFGALYAGYRVANLELENQKETGKGTPMITAIMPRFVEETGDSTDPRDAFLQSIFPLGAPPAPEDWAFAEEEISRVVGVRSIELVGDRVEVVFHGRQLKEKHLFELLTTFNIPVVLDRDIVD